MSLAPSSRVGPYEVLGLIGAGGMGEVYKARDTRLERTVALKVLSDSLSGDPEHRARFEREAKTIAALNHARICTLFDVGTHDGSTFLVMELLDGETLAHRLRRGALSTGVALGIAAEIADALAAAHRHGIVHRDLKPANVMLTASGVKLLDFGLARAGHHEPALAPLASLATRSAPLTAQGVIVGTLQYMAPEQIEGKDADSRADVWALGATLYEMLTGRRAFDGASAATVIGGILNTEPPALTSVQPQTPPAVDRLVRKCLAKDPDARWQSAADLADELRWVREAGAAGATSVRRPMRFAVALAAVTLALAAAGLGIAWRFRPAAGNAAVVSTTIKMDEGLWLDGVRRAEDLQRPSRTAMAMSPDGRYVVFSASRAQTDPRLYLRRMDRPEATAIAGTEGGIAPFISPDSRWIGFWAGGKLKKIPVEGGVATPLSDVPLPFGASWGPNNIILMSSEPSPGLSAVSAEGGTAQSWTNPDPKRDEASHRLPSWLPDGRGVLFTVLRHGYDAHPWVAVLRADTREWRPLTEDAADARYVASGHLVFLRQGTLMAVGFDLDRQEIVGRPVAIVDGVMQAFAPATRFNSAAGQFSVSDTGALVYAAGGVAPDISNALVWVDHAGAEAAAAAKRSSYFAPRLSPDGRKIAYLFYGQERQLWVYDVERETNTRLHDQGTSSYPIWYPDSQRLLFGWQKAVRINLYQQPADRSAPMQRVTTNDCDQRVGSWAPDGDTVAMVQTCAGQWDIVLLSVRSGQVTPLFATAANEMFPEFSPSGPWIAYTSNETKREEVYVQRWRGAGRYQVSTAGGTQPMWSRDGTRLFYRWQDQVWVADIRTEKGGFAAGRPRLLFERRGYSMGAPIRGYDLSRDSQRFLMVKLDDRQPSPATELTLVQNWFEDLKAKVPRGK